MNTSRNPHVYDVIISGAGPVGLFLACELALAKCLVLILEKAESPNSPLKRFPFGIRGLSSPSIESFYRRGLLDELQIHKRMKNPHANAVSGARRQVGHFAGIPFHEGDIDRSEWKFRLPSSNEPSLLSEMEEVETVLANRAEALGVVIKRGHAVTGFQQNDGGVTVETSKHVFHGQWLVGCDGGRSVIRKLGGFEFAGTDPEFTGYSTKVDIANPEVLKAGRVLTDNGMYFQSQPGYVMMTEFDGGINHNAEKPVTREHVQETLRRISKTDVVISNLHFATTWTDRARQATEYRKGRVLLAGDSAHIHSPLGGQGLNLGLGDAMNLGWKLAATIKKQAPEGLLDTYFTERHPIGAQVLDWSRAQVSIMRPSQSSHAMNAIIRDLMNTRDGATYFASRVWGLFTHYNLGDGHPLMGHSVPNFEFADGTKVGEHMREGQALVLDFNSNDSLQAWARKLGIKSVAAQAKEQFGLSALLIRPDGVIAWATEGEPQIEEFEKAAAKFTV